EHSGLLLGEGIDGGDVGADRFQEGAQVGRRFPGQVEAESVHVSLRSEVWCFHPSPQLSRHGHYQGACSGSKFTCDCHVSRRRSGVAESSIQVDRLKIKAAREAKGWSQETLARKTGYKPTTIQKLEQGTYSHPRRCLERCAKVLDVPVAHLLVLGPSEPDPVP